MSCSTPLSRRLAKSCSSIHNDALYLERTPGGAIQVYPNATGEDSKVNLEALFNAVHAHKDVVKALFQ